MAGGAGNTRSRPMDLARSYTQLGAGHYHGGNRAYLVNVGAGGYTAGAGRLPAVAA